MKRFRVTALLTAAAPEAGTTNKGLKVDLDSADTDQFKGSDPDVTVQVERVGVNKEQTPNSARKCLVS